MSKIIRNLKNKRSFGHDELPPILIKYCSEELAPVLAFLVNQSFIEGTVPDLIKISVVKPVYKKDDHTNCANYRPIALLPTFAKILETAMANRIYAYCEKYNIFDEAQNGFRKNHSTSLAVFKYISDTLNLINSRKHAIGVLLDMSKAYDRVLHDIMLQNYMEWESEVLLISVLSPKESEAPDQFSGAIFFNENDNMWSLSYGSQDVQQPAKRD
ncbi:reverse transcriptase (RNA-dependent DNA polymerase) domain-containing protein [Phthorimaea operculella]|nr:reverse transcriptase (RNA-dependent DNA polymerase) domain-containing protein [Phthorimaea operculella]